MNDRTIIRRLILAQWGFWIAAIVLKDLHLGLIPEPLRRQVEPFPRDLIPIALPLMLIVTISGLFSYVTLWRMRPGAGRLFLWVNAIILLPGLFLMPPNYASGLAFNLSKLGTTCFGMTIAWILLGRVPSLGGSIVAPAPSTQQLA